MAGAPVTLPGAVELDILRSYRGAGGRATGVARPPRTGAIPGRWLLSRRTASARPRPSLFARIPRPLASPPRTPLPDLAGASPADITELARAHDVRFLRLQFSDILGVNKNVEIPASQFEKALAGDIMFDGSSIEGFVRIEESDMLLAPDLSTFRIFPWGDPEHRVGRLICDVNLADGSPFSGDPRGALKRVDRKSVV